MLLITFQFLFVIALGTLGVPAHLLRQQSTALRAGVGERFIENGERTLWIIAAAIKDSFLFTYPFHQLAATFRTFHSCLELI